MRKEWLNRPRTTVKAVRGNNSMIGKTKYGRVGLVSKKYAGPELQQDEIWLVDVVHQHANYFIFIPIEKIRDAAETPQSRTVAD